MKKIRHGPLELCREGGRGLPRDRLPRHPSSAMQTSGFLRLIDPVVILLTHTSGIQTSTCQGPGRFSTSLHHAQGSQVQDKRWGSSLWQSGASTSEGNPDARIMGSNFGMSDKFGMVAGPAWHQSPSLHGGGTGLTPAQRGTAHTGGWHMRSGTGQEGPPPVTWEAPQA